MGLDVGDGLEDGLWDRRGSGQQVALGLVAVLVGLVAHTNVLALGGDPLEDSVDVSVDISGGRRNDTVVQGQLADEAIGVHFVDQLLDLGTLVGGHQGGKGADKQLGYSRVTYRTIRTRSPDTYDLEHFDLV